MEDYLVLIGSFGVFGDTFSGLFSLVGLLNVWRDSESLSSLIKSKYDLLFLADKCFTAASIAF